MKNFPLNFKFGWSQSAFQSEMGRWLNLDDRSDWFKWTHDEENIKSGIVSGEFPEDGPGYLENFSRFHDMASYLGLNVARLSIEWSRLFPVKPKIEPEHEGDGDDVTGVFIDKQDLAALDKYVNRNELIRYREIFKDLKRRNILLILNMYHWSLPLWLHDPVEIKKSGIDGQPAGWLSTGIIPQFALYCAYVAQNFDDVVYEYSTMNEPNVIYSGFPPGYFGKEAGKKAELNLIQAHARAYDSIKSVSDKTVGIIASTPSYIPESEIDESAANLARDSLRWPFFDAITNGKTPLGFRQDLARKLDWIGVNYYNRSVIHQTQDGFGESKGYGRNCERNSRSRGGMLTSDFGWEIYPQGVSEVLESFWQRYKLPLWVTENGVADQADYLRSYFLVSSLAHVLKSIDTGVDVRGYLHWTLVDNYEWAHGFSKKFGLIHADRGSGKLYYRQSSLVLKEIINRREIPQEFENLCDPPALDFIK